MADKWAQYAESQTTDKWDQYVETAPASKASDFMPPMNPFEKFMVGMGKGFEDIGTGIGQILGISGASERGKENQIAFTPLAEEKVPYSIGDMKSEITSPYAKAGEFVGQMLPSVTIPGGVSGGIVKKAITSSVAGGAAAGIPYTPESESRAMNILTGAIVGGGVSGLMSGGSKVINALKGAVPSNPVAEMGDRFNIPTTLGEKTGNSFVQGAEKINQKIPLSGATLQRMRQGEAAETAAKKHFSQYVVNPSLDTTAEMKIANDTYLDSLYNTFRAKIQTLPEGEAPEIKKTAGVLLKRYPSVFESIQDNNIKKILKDIYGDVQDKKVETGLFNAQGKPINRIETPQFSASTIWELRKGVGQEIRDARTNTARKQLGALYEAISTDMDSILSKATDPLVDEFLSANEAFKRYSVKFDAMRIAYDKAVGTTGSGEIFSPKKYSTALKNLANDPNYKKNIKWSPGDVEEMTGLANIMQVVKEVGQFQANPENGSRYLSYRLMTDLAKTPLLPVAWATTFLTTTKAGQRLVRAASTVQPNSILMGRIIRQVYNQAPKMAAVAETME